MWETLGRLSTEANDKGQVKGRRDRKGTPRRRLRGRSLRATYGETKKGIHTKSRKYSEKNISQAPRVAKESGPTRKRVLGGVRHVLVVGHHGCRLGRYTDARHVLNVEHIFIVISGRSSRLGPFDDGSGESIVRAYRRSYRGEVCLELLRQVLRSFESSAWE